MRSIFIEIQLRKTCERGEPSVLEPKSSAKRAGHPNRDDSESEWEIPVTDESLA